VEANKDANQENQFQGHENEMHFYKEIEILSRFEIYFTDFVIPDENN